MLHKTDVSNLITGLRPNVKRSVTFLAHRHSKEIKKIENRKGNVTEKLKRKAENLRLESLLLNKIQLDDVIKYALMLDFAQRQKLLDDMELPLESKVMVKIATHKFVVSQLENFRAKHPDWQEKLPDLLKTLGTRAQFKKKIQKQQEKSKRKLERKQQLKESGKAESSVVSNEPKEHQEGEQKVPTVKVNKVLNKKTALKETSEEDSGEESSEDESNEVYKTQTEETNSEIGVSDEVDGDEASSDDSGSDEVDSDEAGSDVAGSDDGGSDDGGSDDADSGNSDEENGDSDIGKGSLEVKAEAFNPKKQYQIKPSRQKKDSNISSGSVFAEVRRFSDLQKEENSERKLNINSIQLPSPDPIENEPVEEDTFFMTGANRFLKTVSVKRQDGEGLASSLDKNEDNSSNGKGLFFAASKNLPGNRRERRAQMMGRALKTKPKRMNSAKEFESSPFHKNDKGFNVPGNNKGFRNQFESNDRRKGNNFADSKRSGREYSGSNKNNVKDDSKFNKQKFGNKNTDESLHPSWEAKRRQKVALDSFQGKKIKFDEQDFGNKNTGNAIQSKTDESLHPSWEAKKRQKVALDCFQGKKIKFDDD